MAGEKTDEQQEKPGFAQEIIAFGRTLITIIVIVFLLRATVVEAFRIPTGSMIPTLQIGDYILVSKLSYGLRVPFMKETLWRYDSPDRNDIVVFTRPDDPETDEDESDKDIIKRVIAIGGDRVEVRGRKVFVNGQAQDEAFARWDHGGIPEGNFGPKDVPEGHIFLLGDNRDNSKDSRFWRHPFLPLDLVKGRALIIYFSWYDFFRIGKLIR